MTRTAPSLFWPPGGNTLFGLVLGVSLLLQPAFAGAEKQGDVSRAIPPHRKKIGLVLAGGGALGFAHVGVLKVLEEQRIPVSFIAGTSMGAIVGAGYASGAGVKEMEDLLSETDWDKLFSDNAGRDEMPYRLKSGRNREITGDAKIAIKDGSIAMPAGFVEGQNIRPLLQRLYYRAPVPCSFDELSIPFRALTADIETGKPVVQSSGDLSLAVRASMSVPTFFTPVEIDGHLLVDGGIANNLPVDVTREMGADILIAVELFVDLKKKDQLGSPLGISGQMISLLLDQNSKLQRALLTPQDILITPDLKGYGSTDFNEATALMARGEAAARAMVQRLAPLGVSEAEYSRWQSERKTKARTVETIDFIEIDNDVPELQQFIDDALTLQPGDPLDRNLIEQEVTNIHRVGYFSQVAYELQERDGKTGVVIRTKEKEWYNSYARLGLSLEDDFDGNSTFTLAGSFKSGPLNDSGAWWETQAEIGTAPRLFSEFVQPIAPASPYFIAPEIEIEQRTIGIRADDDVIARYLNLEGDAAMKVGREFGRFGEASLGIRRGFGDVERDIGSPELPEFSYDTGEAFVRAVYDTADSPDFPTTGMSARVNYISSQEGLGASSEYHMMTGHASVPFTYGRSTWIAGGAFARSFDDLPPERLTSLGGFLNVSGYSRQSLTASDYAGGRLIYFRRVAEAGSGLLGLGMYAGASVEYTNIENDIETLDDYANILSGSVFVGVDTPLAPIYFGFGHSDEDESAVYFNLGRLVRN